MFIRQIPERDKGRNITSNLTFDPKSVLAKIFPVISFPGRND